MLSNETRPNKWLLKLLEERTELIHWKVTGNDHTSSEILHSSHAHFADPPRRQAYDACHGGTLGRYLTVISTKGSPSTMTTMLFPPDPMETFSIFLIDVVFISACVVWVYRLKYQR